MPVAVPKIYEHFVTGLTGGAPKPVVLRAPKDRNLVLRLPPEFALTVKPLSVFLQPRALISKPHIERRFTEIDVNIGPNL